MYDTALGHTTQSKLTVQAPDVGSGVPAISAIRGAMAAAHVLVRCPVSGVGRLNGSLLFCLRKDVALVSYCVPGLGSEDEETVFELILGDGETDLGDGTFHVHRLVLGRNEPTENEPTEKEARGRFRCFPHQVGRQRMPLELILGDGEPVLGDGTFHVHRLVLGEERTKNASTGDRSRLGVDMGRFSCLIHSNHEPR